MLAHANDFECNRIYPVSNDPGEPLTQHITSSKYVPQFVMGSSCRVYCSTRVRAHRQLHRLFETLTRPTPGTPQPERHKHQFRSLKFFPNTKWFCSSNHGFFFRSYDSACVASLAIHRTPTQVTCQQFSPTSYQDADLFSDKQAVHVSLSRDLWQRKRF